ncbi:hypothetical protein M8J77_025360 [Diaphorina citri]|nr:hypothetical protein M8J77_025360 [Diaphorina citri]
MPLNVRSIARVHKFEEIFFNYAPECSFFCSYPATRICWAQWESENIVSNETEKTEKQRKIPKQVRFRQWKSRSNQVQSKHWRLNGTGADGPSDRQETI